VRLALLLYVLLGACDAPPDVAPGTDASSADAGTDAVTTADSAPDTLRPDAVPDAAPITSSLELGTGDVVFEPMTDGTLSLIWGIQGGHHFNVSLRAFGIAPGNPEVRTDLDNPRTVFRALLDGVPIDDGMASYGHAFLPGDVEGAYDLLGHRLIIGVPCAEVADATVTIEATVEDSAGIRLTATQDVIAVPLDPDVCVPAP